MNPVTPTSRKHTTPAVTDAAQTVQQSTPAPAVAAAPTPAPTKAEVTLLRLITAFREKKQITVTPDMLTTANNKVTIVIGQGWPTISIGRMGGVVVNELHSYGDPFEAALNGLELYQKQQGRDAKRLAAATAPAAAPVVATVVSHVATPAPAPAEPKKESVTAKKAKQHAATEEKLAQASA